MTVSSVGGPANKTVMRLVLTLIASCSLKGAAAESLRRSRGERGVGGSDTLRQQNDGRQRQLQMDTTNNDPNHRPVDDTLDDAYTWTDDDYNNRSAWSDLDQFTYQDEATYWPNHIYPPDQWLNVGCFDPDTCLGWPDTFDASEGWKLTANHCQWCPAEGNNTCGKHHSSPIDLFRNVAIIGDPLQNDCIDVHWMQYIDSSCTFEHLQQHNAFTIERYGLKIKQPLQQLDDGTYINGCTVPGVGSRWGKIDFSRGFTQWWLLSHIDFHVPSEHTQNGHRYSAELEMYHFYSIDTDGTEFQTNQMAAISVFLQEYDDAPDYDVLNRLICQWRRVEDRTRALCNLPSVDEEYPGCYYAKRGHNTTTNNNNNNNTTTNSNNNTTADDDTGDEDDYDDLVVNGGNETTSINGSETGYSGYFNLSMLTNRRKLQEHIQSMPDDSSQQSNYHRRRTTTTKSMHDLLVEDHWNSLEGRDGDYPRNRVRSDPREMDGLPLSDDEWRAFLESARSSSSSSSSGGTDAGDASAPDGIDQDHNRHLLDYENVSWNNYFAMLDCKTEYYYRYSGSMTIPPCFGRLRLGENNRINTNNWRVMKDPIRVSTRQINELHRLIRMRIADSTDVLRACQPDTAAKPLDNDDDNNNNAYASTNATVDNTNVTATKTTNATAEDGDLLSPSSTVGRVSTARPLQSFQETHWMVFCMCENWESKFPEDQAWCQRSKSDRIHTHPYNFNQSGY